MKRTSVAPAYVFRKLLLQLDQIRSCAERGPHPTPDLVKQYGERAVIDSTFAMLAGMAGSAIETIEDLAGYTVDDAKAWMEPKPEMVEQLKQVIRSRQV